MALKVYLQSQFFFFHEKDVNVKRKYLLLTRFLKKRKTCWSFNVG